MQKKAELDEILVSSLLLYYMIFLAFSGPASLELLRLIAFSTLLYEIIEGYTRAKILGMSFWSYYQKREGEVY